jgi:hypothetical protein
MMKKVNFNIYCLWLSLVFSTSIFPVKEFTIPKDRNEFARILVTNNNKIIEKKSKALNLFLSTKKAKIAQGQSLIDSQVNEIELLHQRSVAFKNLDSQLILKIREQISRNKSDRADLVDKKRKNFNK